MKLHVENRVLFGFLGTAVVLAVLGVFSFSSTQRLIDTARLLSHATRVINKAEQVVKAIVDIETGQRGFVITGDEKFLEPFYESAENLNSYLNTLDSLTSQNPLQQAKVIELRAFIRHQLEWTIRVIEARRKNFEEPRNMVATGEGKEVTDKIRKIVRDIQNDEREIFRQGNTISGKSLTQFQYSFVGLAIVITSIIVYLFYVINKTLKTRTEAEQQLKRAVIANRDLYDSAPCGYFSVDANICISEVNGTLLRWLKYNREELIGKMKFEDLLEPQCKADFLSTFPEDFENYKQAGYVNDLEFEFLRKDKTTFSVILSSLLTFDEKGEFTGSRTTVSDNTQRKKAEDKVKRLNQELEAFTYSVSHDLRAPLRSIVGYSQILIEDYHEKLDEEGRRIAQIVIKNANRMGKLIDELLDFSRLGRKEMLQAHIDMHTLVGNLVKEMQLQEPNRNLQVELKPLESAKADSSMIRQVWENLLSNAFKYTSKKELAIIEIGSYMEDNQIVYFVRDNGAGFDMEYHGKLFGVFQRLHKTEEFEGIGVGLALVKTIVKRHGGHVWAEGKVNEGAVFYFSIPTEEVVV
ncbi:MAG TPA: CHASE3 domain-containing protein [Cyclobacteriaceae bacterium]|nr:CHASE3 domain-containing protein [Cyclobacteriaceae bacterium]